MKPDDISQGAWDAALKLTNDFPYSSGASLLAVARAILQAHSQAYEECAKIADGYADAMAMAGENGEMLPIAPFIAQAIRSKANQ